MKKRLAVVPVAGWLLAGCGDAMTGPASPERSAPTLSISQSAAGALDFSTDLGDLSARVLPSFEPAAAEELRGYMDQLSAALAAGDKVEAARVLGLARDVLKPGVGHPADIGNFEMVFDRIEAKLGQ